MEMSDKSTLESSDKKKITVMRLNLQIYHIKGLKSWHLKFLISFVTSVVSKEIFLQRSKASYQNGPKDTTTGWTKWTMLMKANLQRLTVQIIQIQTTS